ncbi:TPA: IS1634-like element ISSeq4 family transposase, partial [Streptococcus equi subsp. zooepidemicus]|nr:IS1634-like element ISSeq4 family transposase [Streptococcus equi subsp. zooepidemicus]HEL0040625.1 IS1634-like element ISSeq4 family transposase [Streptococcus equi subsp. zooepidemicus]HEL0042580.1 IS1634-like element ISSeq4 family transposase [Streptococcus equi subsp. zooepidemicus]HEL0056708.1 IS1634-like element ISSeq4 family transposase [Streptococcus equi subsp. zooepidemicus]HEL0073093.1 IS1634-like element ISSeq4 family transposase [Streptococcus equi subsp. zooepidemicus]
AFIKTTTNKEGRTHVYLVEGYRKDGKVKQRILKKFGLLDELELEEPGILERLKREAKEDTLNNPKVLQVSYDLLAPMNQPDQSYGWMVLDNLFESLGLTAFLKGIKTKSEYDLVQVLKLLVFQRILRPDSKLATYASQADLFGHWDISLNAIYRSLNKLNTLKDDLQHHLHKVVSQMTKREASLVFYDVTNYYFETDIPDNELVSENGEILQEGLRRRGPSKEHRPKPIVQLGLFMDTNGIPISYKLFRGNQTDPVTYLPAVEEVKKQFGIERLIVVADKAMNSMANVSEMLKQEDGWLFSQKHRGRRGAPKDIQEHILDSSDWQFNPELTFAKKSYIRERKLGNKKSSPVVQEKVLITWSKKYADRERIRREGALDYASQLTNAELFRRTSKKGGKKYLELQYLDKETGEVKPYSPLITIDQEQADFDAQFDGINVLVTSEIEMTDEEMLNAYKELAKIEDCFRVTKTELESRPVYVWTEKHIQAHFLTCFIALVHLHLLQHQIDWQMSPERIITALNSAKVTPLQDNYYRLQESLDMQELNRLLGIEWAKGIVKFEELKHYAKNPYTTLK